MDYIKIDKANIRERVGNMSQLAGCKRYTLSDGKANGTRAIDVNNGTGLHFTVLVDRGMDIAWADYKGNNLCFISKTGVVSPHFYDSHGSGFLENFGAGLLTTCGLTYMGAPCVDEGEELGMHGRISNVPAENCNIKEYWQVGAGDGDGDDEYIIEIEGKVRQARFFKENIVLTRKITARMSNTPNNTITIKDTVENCAFEAYPLMLLYHFNFGYPIVSEDTKLYSNATEVVARDQDAQLGIDTYSTFETPTVGYKEQVFYHNVKDSDNITACLYNEKLDGGLGVYLKTKRSQLPKLIEWKQMGQSDYVVGVEPATWYPEGRSVARERGELIYINPGEIKEFEIELGICTGKPVTE